MVNERCSHGHQGVVTKPVMPVTVNMGMEMPSWYDVKGLGLTMEEDAEGVQRASNFVHALVDEEVTGGVASERVVVGGFSQGGGLALYSAFTYPRPLAGVVALSTRLPLRHQFPAQHEGKPNLKARIFQAHGGRDPLVLPSFGRVTFDLVKTFNDSITFKLYPGLAHEAGEEEIEDVKQFLDTVLPVER